MKLHIHGVHVPNRKNTAELAALRLPIPETVEIPMSMHIGAPAIPDWPAGRLRRAAHADRRHCRRRQTGA